MKKSFQRRSNFTLIEILIVITIIVVLMTMFKVSISKLFTGHSVDYAAASFKSYCSMVRAQAAVEKDDLSIILVTNIPNVNTKPIDGSEEIFTYRAYRAAKLRELDAPNRYRIEWVKGSKWEMLPVGAYFVIDSIDSDDPGEDSVLEEALSTELEFVNPEVNDSNVTLKGKRILFKGNTRAGDKYLIRIAEGNLQNENNLPTGDFRNLDNSLYVRINQLTGKGKVLNGDEL